MDTRLVANLGQKWWKRCSETGDDLFFFFFLEMSWQWQTFRAKIWCPPKWVWGHTPMPTSTRFFFSANFFLSCDQITYFHSLYECVFVFKIQVACGTDKMSWVFVSLNAAYSPECLMYENKRVGRRLLILRLIARCALWSEKCGRSNTDKN